MNALDTCLRRYDNKEENPENQNWVPAFAGTTWLGAFDVFDGCWGTSQTLMRSLRRDDGKMNAMDTCLRRYDNKEENLMDVQ